MLTGFAAQADEVPGQAVATQAMDAVKQALKVLRRALLERAIAVAAWPRQHAYRLIDTDLCAVLARLWQPGAISVRLCAPEGRSTDLQLLLSLLPATSTAGHPRNSNNDRLLVAVLGGNHALLPLLEDV